MQPQPGHLHQIEVAYSPLEDRMLLKIHTSDLSEFRFWMTRRFVKVLWDILMKLISSDQKNEAMHAQEKEKVAKMFAEEKAKKNPAAAKYAQNISKTPMGEKPILASRIAAKPVEKGFSALRIESETGENIEMVADSYILISFCKVIAETLKSTDWGLTLEWK